MEKYVALIADLKDSRELTEKARIECQEKLYTIINKLNLILNNSLFKKLVFSAGDSIQGLFYNLKDAIYCYYLIKNFLYPYEIRSGIGLGSIYNLTPNLENENDSNYMDGDAYHQADFALEISKAEDLSLIIKSDNLKNDVLLNQLFHSIAVLEKKQTKKQREINIMINILAPALFESFLQEDKYNEYRDLIKLLLQKNISSYKITSESIDNINFLDLTNKGFGLDNVFNEKRIFLKEPINPSVHLQISEILGITRESVRQTVESGLMNEIRRLEILALLNSN
ncbi:MAG: SatD family protein [Bacilli bacterium]